MNLNRLTALMRLSHHQPIQARFAPRDFPFTLLTRLVIGRCLALRACVSQCGRDDGDVSMQAGSLRSARRMRALSTALVESRNETCIQPAGDEFFIAHNLAKERHRRLDSSH